MLIKILEGTKGKVTLKLTQNQDKNGKDIFILESNTVDAQKNQKIKVDSFKNCSNILDANNRFNNIVEDYIAKGYTEIDNIKKKDSSENTEKPSFLNKIFKKFK